MKTNARNQTKKPRFSDVARWVAILAAPMPDRYMVASWRMAAREKDAAQGMLRMWGLGDDGQPVVKGAES